MNDQKRPPMFTLTCKACGRVFECKAADFLERAGKVPCSECGKTIVYSYGDIKTLPSATP